MNPEINSFDTSVLNRSQVYKFSVGSDHLCFEDEYDFLTCVGDNVYGQMYIPVSLMSHNIHSFITGAYHSCGIFNQYFNQNEIRTQEFHLDCWGLNLFGQTDIPLNVTENINLSQELYSGPDTTCLKLTSGDLKCWGRNSIEYSRSIPPHFLDALEDFELSISYSFMCGIGYDQNDHYLSCWGDCSFGVCDIPIPDVSKKEVVDVKVGKNHVCVIRLISELININLIKDVVVCWGSDSNGQLVPKGPDSEYVISLALGNGYTCIVRSNFILNCYGDYDGQRYNSIRTNVNFGSVEHADKINDVDNENNYNNFKQLEPTNTSKSDFQNLMNLHNINNYARFVSVGGRNTCVLIGGYTRCIGNNEFGQNSIPQSLISTTKVTKSGWDYNCAISTSHQLKCWGFNYLGQTDAPTHDTTQRESKRRKTNANNKSIPNQDIYYFLKLSSGLTHSCAIIITLNSTYNSLICWGGRDHYQELVPPLSLSSLDDISVGDEHTCASTLIIRPPLANKLVYCWGSNEFGQSAVPEYYAKQKTSNLTAGGAHTCLKVTLLKALVCWGSDLHGQLRPPAHMVVNVFQVRAGTMHTCASTEEGKEVYCWGYVWKDRGAVWAFSTNELEAGYGHICAVDVDAVVHCTGDDEYGQVDVQSMVK